MANYPWTTGGLIPYDKESKAYATQMKQQFPSGANVALFSVNSEFGQVYVDAFKEIAGEGGIDDRRGADDRSDRRIARPRRR